MLRVLHIARATTSAANAKIAVIAREPDLSLRLIRPPDADAGHLDRAVPPGALELVRVWRRRNPHRGLYATLGFHMRAASPDIVHVEEEPDSLAALQVAAARRLIAPAARLVLHTWQNVDRPKRAHVRAVLAANLRAADAVLCASETAVTVLRAHGFRGPAPIIVPAGFDPDTFYPRPAARPDGVFTVGYVGRLVPEKGLDTLVSAAARLQPPVRLELAGTGGMEAALARQARVEGIADDRICFLGRLPAIGVAALLCRIHVLVLPSRTTPVWAEQFGRVLAEAMACGTPVVGSNSGEIPKVIGDAGVVFPEGDADALAARLRELRDRGELWRCCSERGVERASLYSPGRIGGQTAALYRQLAARPREVSR